MRFTKTVQKTSKSPTNKSPATSKKKSSVRQSLSTPKIFFKDVEIVEEKELAAGSLDEDVPRGSGEYEERYIAFVDILGFKDLVNQSQNDPSKVQALSSALDTIRPSSPKVILDAMDVEQQEDFDLRIHTFSDFVVASVPPTNVGLCALAYVIWNLSTAWLSTKILCRGGITKGKCLHRGGPVPMVFGPAFVAAYELESSVADMPRVILSKEVRLDWQRFVAQGSLDSKLQLLVQQCEDGPHCIDIFCHLRKSGFDLVTRDWPEEANEMRTALVDRLDDTAEKPAVYRKALWLAKRFNKAILRTQYASLQIDVSESM